MFLESFSCQGIRNLNDTNITLNAKLNVFLGDNGAGKSSILEAVSLLTSGRSFRTNKLDLIVSEEKIEFFVFGCSNDNNKFGLGFSQKDRKKTIKINHQKIKTLSSLIKLIPTQILSPESYHLIDSGPSDRRKFIDWCMFHVEHDYHQHWKNYTNILNQRNALLKQMRFSSNKQEISVWDTQLCLAADKITQLRLKTLRLLEDKIKYLIKKLNIDFCTDLQIGFYRGFSNNLQDKLNESFASDVERGYTKFGPHKADLKIKNNKILVKDYLSRGQKKVLINLLFLAQTLLLKELTSKDSLFIIDDFTSELDDKYQLELLSALMEQKNVQIIVSCLQQDSLKRLKKVYNNVNMFHVEHGVVVPIEFDEN